jgi:hypothetical protein
MRRTKLTQETFNPLEGFSGKIETVCRRSGQAGWGCKIIQKALRNEALSWQSGVDRSLHDGWAVHRDYLDGAGTGYRFVLPRAPVVRMLGVSGALEKWQAAPR